MKNFERLYQSAADNYGLVSVSAAQDMEIHRKELLHWTKIGRLTRCGRGVYRISHYLPTELDQYAEAVALVGGDAMIYGDGALAMHNLALVNPRRIKVACSNRIRRKLPEWVMTVKMPPGAVRSDFNGIPSQDVADAIRTCKGTVMLERLLAAVDDAEKNGLVARRDAARLREELAV